MGFLKIMGKMKTYNGKNENLYRGLRVCFCSPPILTIFLVVVDMLMFSYRSIWIFFHIENYSSLFDILFKCIWFNFILIFLNFIWLKYFFIQVYLILIKVYLIQVYLILIKVYLIQVYLIKIQVYFSNSSILE